MTYMDGSPIEGLAEQPLEIRNHAISLLFSLLFKELFEFRLVQTDPNFANYLYQLDNQKLVLLDFGATREYSASFSEGYRQLFSAALQYDDAGMEAALVQIGFFSEEVASSQRQAVIKLVHLACEPVRCDQEYDFGNSDLATRLREGGTRLSMEQGYWHSPPADALFLHRKIGGLYLLAARLKAKINLYALLAPHLIAKVP